MNSNEDKNENPKSTSKSEEEKFEVINTNSNESSKESNKKEENWEKVGDSKSSNESLGTGAQETENELVKVKPSSKGNIVSQDDLDFNKNTEENMNETLPANETIISEEKKKFKNEEKINKNQENKPDQTDENNLKFQTIDKESENEELDLPKKEPLLSQSVTNQSIDDSQQNETNPIKKNSNQDLSKKKKIMNQISGYRRISITKAYDDTKNKPVLDKNVSNENSNLLNSVRTESERTIQNLKNKESPSDSSMLNLREDIHPISKLKTSSFEKSKISTEQDKNMKYQAIEHSQLQSQIAIQNKSKIKN